MNSKSFSTTFAVTQSPEEVFAAINNPRGWWSQAIKGDTDRLGAVFYHQYRDSHRCTLNITELVPGKRIVWHVLQNYFDFVEDETEWTGTDVVFEIAAKDGKTAVRFTHVGLSPVQECYDVCSGGWSSLVNGSLRAFITAGKDNPEPAAASERGMTTLPADQRGKS